MKLKKIIITSLINLVLLTNTFAIENKILFKINNEIITSVDILKEIQYLKLLNKGLENLSKDKIFDISKNSIIREKIKEIELKKYVDNFQIDEKYYDVLFGQFIQRLDIKSKNEFINYIKINNIEIEDIEKKIKMEVFWNQLIVEKFSKDVKIDKNKIKSEISKNNLQKEIQLSEILFSIDKNEKLEKKYNIIKKEIETTSFENAALIYSISNSASNGGKVGWINSNSLNPKIKSQVLKIKSGSHTGPIVVPGGFIILKINDEKNVKIIEDIDKETDLIAKDIANKQLRQFSTIYFNKIKKEMEINEFK